jgi:hypothetical protein
LRIQTHNVTGPASLSVIGRPVKLEGQLNLTVMVALVPEHALAQHATFGES